MIVQEYLIHMKNLDVISVDEEFEMVGPKTLIGRFGRAKPDTMLRVGNSIQGFYYFKAQDVSYISTGEVKEVPDWDDAMADQMDHFYNREKLAFKKCDELPPDPE